MPASEEQPKQAQAHRADLPACLSQGSPGHASPPCPAVGSHRDHCLQPYPAEQPQALVSQPPMGDCMRAMAAACQFSVPTAQLRDVKLPAPKSQAGLCSKAAAGNECCAQEHHPPSGNHQAGHNHFFRHSGYAQDGKKARSPKITLKAPSTQPPFQSHHLGPTRQDNAAPKGPKHCPDHKTPQNCMAADSDKTSTVW